jgi:hypothetical protein
VTNKELLTLELIFYVLKISFIVITATAKKLECSSIKMCFPGANTLAYFPSESATNKKVL